MKLFFDIETSALPLEQLAPIMPKFEAGSNLKDPEKIKAAIESKNQDWLDSAALRATTGEIVAISFCIDDKEPVFMSHTGEAVFLENLQFHFRNAISGGGTVYAWNIFGFDLPFFCQRCAIHGIPAFRQFTTNYRGRWSWHECFVDPMQVWCGPYQRSDGASLKAVGYALGLGLKTGNGKDFAELLKSDPEAAKAYALLDVKLLRGIVEKMGI